MGLSIITPHYNDLDGLKRIFACLKGQTSSDWEWIIVDDFSASDIIIDLKKWCEVLELEYVTFIFNSKKTNGSVCRNIGVDASHFNSLVFLDSDDLISPNFVANRQLHYNDFAIFGNYQVLYQKKVADSKKLNKGWNFLDRFLSAQFLWQTSCILWNKDFFNHIGRFHPDLPRLQDVELSIRALQKSNNYNVIDNSIDFYYQVKPIRERKGFVRPVCDAVSLFVSELLDTTTLTRDQISYISGYYYLCIKYFERSESFDSIAFVRKNLNLFYKKSYITFIEYILGILVLKFFVNGLLSKNTFLRANRFLFKP